MKLSKSGTVGQSFVKTVADKHGHVIARLSRVS